MRTECLSSLVWSRLLPPGPAGADPGGPAEPGLGWGRAGGGGAPAEGGAGHSGGSRWLPGPAPACLSVHRGPLRGGGRSREPGSQQVQPPPGRKSRWLRPAGAGQGGRWPPPGRPPAWARGERPAPWPGSRLPRRRWALAGGCAAAWKAPGLPAPRPRLPRLPAPRVTPPAPAGAASGKPSCSPPPSGFRIPVLAPAWVGGGSRRG